MTKPCRALTTLIIAGCVMGSALAQSPEGRKPGTAFRDCPECPEMMALPAGNFVMGSPDNEVGRFSSEGPVRVVTIEQPFAIGRFEVTRGQFAAFVNETGHASSGCAAFRDGKFQHNPSANWRVPGYPQDDDHPAVCVNWDDAQAYAAWLSRKSGKRYRLPTEAEWEYAARGATKTAFYWGDNANNNACQFANVADRTARAVYAHWVTMNCADRHVHTAVVGSFQPNAFGLYDMAGNVWEWTEDCWNANYSGAPTHGGAWTSGECNRRVGRGGSWDAQSRYFRSAFRFGFNVSVRDSHGGFRVAATQ